MSVTHDENTDIRIDDDDDIQIIDNVDIRIDDSADIPTVGNVNVQIDDNADIRIDDDADIQIIDNADIRIDDSADTPSEDNVHIQIDDNVDVRIDDNVDVRIDDTIRIDDSADIPTENNVDIRIDDNADIQIIFRDKGCMNVYKLELEACLKQILRNNEKFIITSKSEGQIKDENPFCIDVTPSTTASRSFSSIKYTPSFSTPLAHFSHEIEQKQKDLSTHLSTCFNCNGNHHIKDCTEVYNAFRVSSNRRKFSSSHVTSSRYHKSDQLRFSGKFQAGQLSKKLRRALGLKHNELPPYIYNMRLLGYPPAWLKEAKIESSGIKIYDSEAKEEHVLDSETDRDNSELYDGNKFVKFPGFNVPIPSGIQDEWERYGAPPMAQHQQISEALKHDNVTTTASTSYKKRKLSSTEVKPVKKPKRPRTDYSSGECTSSDDSEFENEKSKTLAETSVVGCRPIRTVKILEKDKNLQDEGSYKNNGKGQNSNSGTLFECEIKSKNEQNGKSPLMNSSSNVASYVPVFNTPNPIKKLPDYKNFSDGITEHENFANLPHSTGRYKRIRKVLAYTKKKLSRENKK